MNFIFHETLQNGEKGRQTWRPILASYRREWTSMPIKLSHKLDKPSICPRGMARVSGKVSTPISKTPLFISLMPEIPPPETTPGLNTDLSFSEFFLFQSGSFTYFFTFPKWHTFLTEKENLKTY